MQREERRRWLGTHSLAIRMLARDGFGKLEKVSPESGGFSCSPDLAPLPPGRCHPTPQPLA